MARRDDNHFRHLSSTGAISFGKQKTLFERFVTLSGDVWYLFTRGLFDPKNPRSLNAGGPDGKAS